MRSIPLSLSLPRPQTLSDQYSDDSRCESRSLGPTTPSKSEDSCLDSLVPPSPHVCSVINLICVYTIHTSPLQIAVVMTLCMRSAFVLTPRRSIYLRRAKHVMKQSFVTFCYICGRVRSKISDTFFPYLSRPSFHSVCRDT